MDKESKGFEFLLNYMIHIAVLGAICGAVYFALNSETTSVIEAILTPLFSAIGFVFGAFLIVLAFGAFDCVCDTDEKKKVGGGALILLSIVICVSNVL